MDMEYQIISGYRNLLNKLIWLNKYSMEASLNEFTSTEVHCIEYIGENQNSNVTKLADAFFMTRGAISKLTKKLIEKGVIENYQINGNKKEIYFKLTEKGKSVYSIHARHHANFRHRDKIVYDGFTDEELEIILNFAKKYNAHLDGEISKIEADIKL